MSARSLIVPAHEGVPFPTVPLDLDKLLRVAKNLEGVKYGLGWKASPIDVNSGVFMGRSPLGLKGRKIDCSGFVRYLMNKAIDGFLVPDGSVNQHDWVRASGFKPSADMDAMDGALRIAFIPPRPIGHVVLILNGWTFESHGGLGVDRRKWGSCKWMSRATGYVLTAPIKGD